MQVTKMDARGTKPNCTNLEVALAGSWRRRRSYATASEQIVQRKGLALRVLREASWPSTDHIALLGETFLQASSSASEARICDAIASCPC